jgi:membrane-associated phospholipid phosphatase
MMRCFFTATLCCVALTIQAGELQSDADDAKTLAKAPFYWKAPEWRRFAEGVGVVAAVMVADRRLEDAFQRNRSSFTDSFARQVTPFGAARALEISGVLIGTGWLTHNENVLGAGRDSLEAEIWAAGIVTPLLKDTFGRARPVTGEGTWQFHGFRNNNADASLPSGHATNAFAAATAIAAHSDGYLIPTIAYTLATGVAFSRVNDRAHFPSDVVAGALIGRAVARSIAAHHARVRLAPLVTRNGLGFTASWSRQ